MVYLGGLLILFLYFTSIINFFKNFNKKLIFFLIFFLVFPSFFFIKDVNIIKTNFSGIYIFSFYNNIIILILIFLLLIIILFLISFLRKLSSPIRQN